MVASQEWLANNLVTVYDVDPDDSTATDVGWVDMSEYNTFTAIAIRTIGTGATDGFLILSNPNSDGSGSDTTIKTHAIGSEPNAIPDFVVLECNSEELGTDRYVSASIELATSTDEFIVVYVRSHGKSGLDLTADTIA